MQGSTKSSDLLWISGILSVVRQSQLLDLRYRVAETRIDFEGSIRTDRVLCSVTRTVSEEPDMQLLSLVIIPSETRLGQCIRGILHNMARRK